MGVSFVRIEDDMSKDDCGGWTDSLVDGEGSRYMTIPYVGMEDDILILTVGVSPVLSITTSDREILEY